MKNMVPFLLLMILLNSCKPVDNPCTSVSEPTGKFIYNNLTKHKYIIPDEVRYFDFGDTFLCYSGQGYIELSSLDTGCNYLWVYKQDTYRTKDIVLHSLPVNMPIEVSLQVSAKDPHNCLDIEKRTKKTIRKFFGIENSSSDKHYYGQWKGSFTDSPNIKVVIDIKKALNDSINYGYMRNLDTKECYPNYFLTPGVQIDHIVNLPALNDLVSVSREEGRAFSINQEQVINTRKLKLLAINNCYAVKNICSYNPFYYPSIYCLVGDKNQIEIIVVGEQYYDTKKPLFKRIFKGIKI